MKLQNILDQDEIQKELDRHMRAGWAGIPENFKPTLNLLKPYALQDLTEVNIKGINNYSDEVITLKELNFLYLYCFVADFYLFYNYERASEDERQFYVFPEDLKIFRKYSKLVEIQELQNFLRAYKDELENYINITGRICLYSILD
jgi:hypothetical protein